MIAGIDPGLGGAIAFLHADGSCAIDDLPAFEVKRGGKKRRDLDGHSLFRMIERERPPLDHVFIEQAQAMPGQSAYATGIFFQVYGEILGILIGAQVPYTIVHPKTWKAALGVPAAKDAARARASQLLPHAAHLWPLKKHDGRAEAALIALWGRRQIGADERRAPMPETFAKALAQ